MKNSEGESLSTVREKKTGVWLTPVTAVLLFTAVAVYKGLFRGGCLTENEAFSYAKLFGILSDSALIPGVILFGIGGLGYISTFGTFDMLAYSSKKLIGHFFKKVREELPKTYYDYQKEKREEANVKGWPKRPFFYGIALIVLSIVFAVISSLFPAA